MAGFGIPNPISGVLFGGEDDAHKFIIREMSGQAFSGTVTAKFLRYADNVTVPLTGSIEDGAATVTLIENCYTRPGRFKLTVYVTAGGSTTAIYCCMGTVDRTDGASAIDPSGEINLDVTDLINQINTATASIPADYSDLLATIASTYSNSSTYAGGDYVWYDGDLYRCTTAITTAESWTAAHWTAAVIGEDVADLKSAIDASYGTFSDSETSVYFVSGAVNTSGSVIDSTTRLVSCNVLKYVKRFYVPDGYKAVPHAYNGSTYVGALDGTEYYRVTNASEFRWKTGMINLYNPNNYGYLIVIAKSDDSTISAITSDFKFYSSKCYDSEEQHESLGLYAGNKASEYYVMTGKYIHETSHDIRATSNSDRTISIKVEPNTQYRIMKATATTVRVGFGSVQDPSVSAVVNNYASCDNTAPTDFKAVSGASDTYMYIQLFVGSDADDTRTLEANISTLIVCKDNIAPIDNYTVPLDLAWFIGYIESNGKPSNSGQTNHSKYVFTYNFIKIKSGSVFKAKSGYKIAVSQYDDNLDFIERVSATPNPILVNRDCYVRVACGAVSGAVVSDIKATASQVDFSLVKLVNLHEYSIREEKQNNDINVGMMDITNLITPNAYAGFSTSLEIGDTATCEFTDSTSWGYYIIPVNVGDVVNITGKGGAAGSSKASVWVLVSDDGKLCGRHYDTNSGVVSNLDVYIWERGLLYVNVQLSQPYSVKRTTRLSDLCNISKFDKRQTVNFGSISPSAYYKLTIDEFNDGFSADTTAAEMYAKFDALVTAFPNDVTKTDLGSSCVESKHLYEYDIIPKRYTYAPYQKKIPKILIIGGQHGFEKSNVMGLYYFVKDLLTNPDQNDTLGWIRANVCLKIIPVCNPSGWDANTYDNANGVNLNRNYYAPTFPMYPDAEPGSDQYGGVEPFDQPETAIVRDFVLANPDAVLFVDFHTNGRGNVQSYEYMNQIMIGLFPDSYFKKVFDVMLDHISRQTVEFKKQFSFSDCTSTIGYIEATGTDRAQSYCWVSLQNIVGILCEGLNGFVTGSTYTGDVFTANAQIIGNLIAHFMSGMK